MEILEKTKIDKDTLALLHLIKMGNFNHVSINYKFRECSMSGLEYIPLWYKGNMQERAREIIDSYEDRFTEEEEKDSSKVFGVNFSQFLEYRHSYSAWKSVYDLLLDCIAFEYEVLIPKEDDYSELEVIDVQSVKVRYIGLRVFIRAIRSLNISYPVVYRYID